MTRESKHIPFWKSKSLSQMTRSEWESLCDGCARCCLNKYEDEERGTIHYTDVACHLLDRESCRCSDYKNRTAKVPDCITLTVETLAKMTCLPPTCAYRLLAEGKDLDWWHPLVSGDPSTVHSAGISVQGRCISEKGLTEAEIENRLVRWPLSRKTTQRKEKIK
jgi:uncharacterized cysteine cluster protein YcgN (CxxCxxCC family)